MKNALFVILAMILLIGVSGCASKQSEESAPAPPTGAATTTTKEAATDLQALFAKIQEGQSKSEVISFLGEPTEKQSISGKELEYWYYQAGTDVLQVAFDSGTVSAKRLY